MVTPKRHMSKTMLLLLLLNIFASSGNTQSSDGWLKVGRSVSRLSHWESLWKSHEYQICQPEFLKLRHTNTNLLPLSRIYGQWVSQRCETRPGSGFVLRDYHFLSSGNFKLVQYYYSDETCSVPLYATEIEGDIAEMSKEWSVKGANKALFKVYSAHVTAYQKRTADTITIAMRTFCQIDSDVGKFSWPSLDIFEKYPVAYRSRYKNDPSTRYVVEPFDLLDRLPKNAKKIHAEYDCLASALNISVDELGLIMIRQTSTKDGPELFLGDVLFNVETRSWIRPSRYQQPMFDPDETFDCATCRKVREANLLQPPVLRQKDNIKTDEPSFDMVEGQWFSEECESFQHGLFGYRHLHLEPRLHSWRMRVRYFDDPKCRVPSHHVMASGTFSSFDKSSVFKNTHLAKFKVTSVRISPQSMKVTRRFRKLSGCGARGTYWRKGKVVDLTPSGGCVGLGIEIPTVINDILRVHQGNDGMTLPTLSTGDYATVAYSGEEFPTKFLNPLRQCAFPTIVLSLESSREHPDKNKHLISNERMYYTSMLKSSVTRCYSNVHYLILTIPLLLISYVNM